MGGLLLRCARMARDDEESRVMGIVKGVALLVLLSVVILIVLLGWRVLPGLLGEWVGMIVGLVSTPFILEFFFVTLGLVLVITINHFRQRREGDELVYLEQVEGPEGLEALPERSRWAVYPDAPLDGVAPGLLERAEGAWAIGEAEEALRWIAEMSPAELAAPATLALRVEIARATGKPELAERLERRGADAGVEGGK
jgi:hypothetical protein